MRRYFSLSSLALALAMIATAATTSKAATSTILFSDDFDGRTTGSGDGNENPAGTGNGASDWGTNNNNLGGTNTAAYITTPSRSGGANQTVGSNALTAGIGGGQAFLIAGDAVVGYENWLGSAPDGFSIAFRFDRNLPATPAGGGFIAVGLGIDSTTLPTAAPQVGAVSVDRGNFSVLFQQANAGNLANAEAFSDADANLATPRTSLGTFDYLDPLSAADVLLTFTPTVSGAYGLGSIIDYSVAVNGSTLQTGSFSGNGSDLSRISFSNNNFNQRYIDNLVITGVTAIPEPSTTAALAIAGLGGVVIARRRKKASVAKV